MKFDELTIIKVFDESPDRDEKLTSGQPQLTPGQQRCTNCIHLRTVTPFRFSPIGYLLWFVQGNGEKTSLETAHFLEINEVN